MELNTAKLQFETPASTKTKLLIGVGLGILGLVIAFMAGPTNGWRTLINAAYQLTTWALFGLYLVAIFHVSGTEWGIVVRRIPENLTKALPIAGGLVLVVIAGFYIDSEHMYHIYEWANPQVVETDKIIKHKSAFLVDWFFIVRLAIAFGAWILYSKLFNKYSFTQDEDGDIRHTISARRIAPVFLLVFALTYSLFGVDLLMSATPHWFSTMFGVYCFAGLAQSGFAITILFVQYLKKQDKFGSYLNENHIHDLGKFMWGHTIFYAYIAFSQFMLIWYAAIPEETFFYEDKIKSMEGGLMAIALVMLRFAIPFFAIITRSSKRNIGYLSKIAWIVIIGQVVDIAWIVFFGHHGGHGDAPAGMVIGGVVLSVIGTLSILALVTLKGLEKRALIPVKEPRLEESLHFHQ